jgi:hypothetical protein
MRELVIQPPFQLKSQLLTVIRKMLSQEELSNQELCLVLANSDQVDSLMNDIEPAMRKQT